MTDFSRVPEEGVSHVVCGIFGIIDSAGVGVRQDDAATLSALAKCLTHRGPDGGSGILTDQVAIGMQRLAIIDPAGGMQPLWGPDQRREMP